MLRMSNEERSRAVGMLEMGASFRQVARVFNRRMFTIQQLWRKNQATGSVHDELQQAQDRYIVLTYLRSRKRSATVTARETVGNHHRHISSETVRNRLREAGIRCRRPCKGVILTERHRRERLQWARRHVRMTRAEWANVLFTDESRFNLRRSDGRARVYRRRGERFSRACISETDRYGGGSVMVWGGISLHTMTQRVVVQGNLNAQRYQNEIVLPFIVLHFAANRGMVLAQDNAPCHVARGTLQMLADNNVRTLPWPSRSPDLNPIEHVWDLVERRIRLLALQHNLVGLQRDVIQVWADLTQQTLRSYICSMRSRCRAVIRARGGHTRY